MTVGSSFSSGIVGLAGRLTDHREPVTHSAEFRLAGAGLPLVSPARVYICGITPYDVTHLGHAATFVWADAAQSVLRSAGVQTVSCRNVTDIDDVRSRFRHGNPMGAAPSVRNWSRRAILNWIPLRV